MAIQNDLNIQKNMINGVVESNDWDPHVFEEKDIMLDLSNYTYKGYITSYYYGTREVTLPAGTYLFNNNITTEAFKIGSAVLQPEKSGDWLKVKISSSQTFTWANDNYGTDSSYYVYYWKQN